MGGRRRSGRRLAGAVRETRPSGVAPRSTRRSAGASGSGRRVRRMPRELRRAGRVSGESPPRRRAPRHQHAGVVARLEPTTSPSARGSTARVGYHMHDHGDRLRRDSVADPAEQKPGRMAGQIAATRAAAILMYAGVRDVRLLDGGYNAGLRPAIPSRQSTGSRLRPRSPERRSPPIRSSSLISLGLRSSWRPTTASWSVSAACRSTSARPAATTTSRKRATFPAPFGATAAPTPTTCSITATSTTP